ncbi:MAG: tetratricopeptide repeat protein, partial [Paludibacteraceae bacterium]|nr:tetratricopeptide repeat protein [Paludibacteraceae bacterium]
MKRIFLVISLTALAVLQCNGLSAADNMSAEGGLFAQANDFYQQSDYEQAAQLYEQYVAQYPSADAYYNLGNAYFKQGNLSHAILSYERSLRLNPRDKDCKHNLAFAKTQIIDNVEDNTFILSSWATAIRNQLTQKTWFILSIVLWCLTLIALLLYS